MRDEGRLYIEEAVRNKNPSRGLAPAGPRGARAARAGASGADERVTRANGPRRDDDGAA